MMKAEGKPTETHFEKTINHSKTGSGSFLYFMFPTRTTGVDTVSGEKGFL